MLAPLVGSPNRTMQSPSHESIPEGDGHPGHAARRAREEMRNRVASRLFGLAPTQQRIGRFQIEDFVGAGGMGSVYVAHDPKLGRKVAIKLLHAGLVEEGSEGEHERLVREAFALAQLSHPNVVQVHDVGAHQGRVFLAMEYVEGASLRDWQRESRRSWRELVRMYCQAARGLVAAHDAGVVHRDFKPSNVLVGSDGRARVADFGLARSAGSSEPVDVGESSPGPEASPLQQSLTRTGAVLGTPAYMAPEQLAGQEVSDAADQWSFCVALWEALYGVRPFSADALRDHESQLPPCVGQRNGPRSVRGALMRGLKRDPSARWPSLRSLADALESIVGPRRLWPALSVTAVVAAAGAAFAAGDGDPCRVSTEAIDGVWGDEARTTLASSLEPLAPGVASHAVGAVLGDLDRFRGRWLDAKVDACKVGLREDATSAARASTAAQCLDLSLVRLGAAVDVLREADVATFAAADAMLDAVGDPQACVEIGLVPVGNGELLSELEAARVELASGQPPSDSLSRLLERDSSLWDEPSPRVAVVAHELRGRARVQAGATERGVEDLLVAVRLAEANRLDRAAATLWLELVETATNHLVSTEHATAWLDRADAAVARVGSPGDLRLKFLRAAALVAREQKRWEEARRNINEALAIVPLPVGLAGKLKLELADVEVNTGSEDSGAAGMTRVLDRFVEELGPSHPYVADARIYVGRLARQQGDLDAAKTHFEEATRIREEAYGLDSPRVSTPLMGLAAVLAGTGDLDGAMTAATRVVELQRGLPKNHVERGGGLSVVGAIAQARSDHETAAVAFAELADEWKAGPRANERIKALTNAAWNYMMLGEAAQARPLYAALRAETPPEDEFHTIGLAGLGRVDHLLGDHETALVELEAALGIAEKRDIEPDANEELLPEIQWHLSEVLGALGRQDKRRCKLAAAAMSRYEKWPERKKAREALAVINERCATEGNER